MHETTGLPYRKIAIALVAALLAALAIETTVRDMARQSGIPIGVRWWPDDARMVLRRSGLDEAVLLNRRSLKPVALGPARKAFAIDPLDPLPLVIAGDVARLQGRRDVALAAFRAARRTDPRLFLARYQLMQQLVETGSVGDGVDEIISTADVVAGYDDALMPALAQAATAADLRKRVFAGLRRFPSVRQRMIVYLSLAGADDPLLQSLLRLGADRETLDTAIGNLARRGQVAKATALWRSTYRPPNSMFDGFVFDGAFFGHSAPASMGWQKQTDPNLSIAIGAPDGAPGQLQVTAFGSLPAIAVQQFLILPPGNYRFVVKAGSSTGEGAGGAFAWVITCGDFPSPLAILSFDSLAATKQSKAVAFSVPSGCARQTLKLVSTPVDASTSYALSFDEVSVRAQ